MRSTRSRWRPWAGLLGVLGLLSGVLAAPADGMIWPTGVVVGRSPARPSVLGADNLERIFAPDSFWYQRLAADAPVAAQSSTWVSELASQVRTYYGGATINIGAYSVPVYVASATQSVQPVGLWDCQHKGYLDASLAAQFRAVPIPRGAQPASGSDHDLVVWQPSGDRLWEFWQMRHTVDGWQACWGGQMTQTTRNIGRFPLPFGTSATGLALAGGLITPAELRQGAIDHALAMEIPLVRAGVESWPAERGDGTVADPSAIAEGQRFRLNPSVDVATLPMSPVGKIIAQAVQTYGVIVTDHAGAVALEAQSPTSAAGPKAADPYTLLFAGEAPYQVLNGFPWDELEALPMNYGAPAASRGARRVSPRASRGPGPKALGHPAGPLTG